MKKIMMGVVFVLLLTGCKNSTVNNLKEDNTKQELTQTKVSFIGVGDNLIHERMYQVADENKGSVNDGEYDFSPFYTELATYFKNADLCYVNQETIIGGDEFGPRGYPSFNTPEIMADTLNDLGVDIVNNATNHCLDMGFTGIQNSCAKWRQFPNIVTAGIHDSKEDQETIKTIERNGIKFAVLSYTYGTNGIEAPNDYCVDYFDEQRIRDDVAKAKSVSDAVIVLAHWGDEYQMTTNAMQDQYAQLFADLEVDLVVGCHPHVIGPMEWVEGVNGNKTLVVYSLGNMISGMLEKECQLGGMISLNFVKDEATGEITIEDVTWIPLVNHYEGDASDIMSTRTNFKSYPLKNYTDELANQHGLNGYEGITITREYFVDLTQQVISDEFKIDL